MRKHSCGLKVTAIACPGFAGYFPPKVRARLEDIWPRDSPLLRYKSGSQFQQYSGGCNAKGDERVHGYPFRLVDDHILASNLFHNGPNPPRCSALEIRVLVRYLPEITTALFSDT